MSLLQKERELKKMKSGRPPYSYAPTRKSLFDIFNIETGFLIGLPRTPWSQIERKLLLASKHDDECKANLRISRALYNFSDENRLLGRRQDFLPLSIGVSHKVKFWHPAVIAVQDSPFIIFTDPRTSSAKLTTDGRRFIFSIMHERIRVAEEDYSTIGLGIIQLKKLDEKTCSASLFAEENDKLFSFEDLNFMIRETYELWEKIQFERFEEARGKRTGTSGPLI